MFFSNWIKMVADVGGDGFGLLLEIFLIKKH
jgi:hypothetical protein